MLTGLQDSKNQTVWVEFDNRYRPVLFGVARRIGLSAADAEDIVQQTLTEFFHDYMNGRYDRKRGRLHSWLFGIVRHRIIDLQRASKRYPEKPGQTAIVNVPDESLFTSTWDTERAAAILQLALNQLREEERFTRPTMDAFEQYGLRGQSVASVASQCGLTVDDVYAAKYRVGKALKTLVQDIEETYDL